EPAERIHLLVLADGALRHARSADAVEAVAARDEIAIEPMLAAVLAIRDVRLRAVEIVNRDVLRLVNRRQPLSCARLRPGARALGVAGVRDAPAAREPGRVDALAFAPREDLAALVPAAFAMHSLADAGFVEQVHGDLLEHPGADAAQHVFAGPALEDHGVDAGLVQQLTEYQAGRAGADDCDLGSHERLPSRLRRAAPNRSSQLCAEPRAARMGGIRPSLGLF